MEKKFLQTQTINPMPVQAKIAGLIFAGGRGMRMGGVDKALIMHEGRPLVDWVSSAMLKHVAHLYISRQGDQASLAQFGEVIIDCDVDQGPLAGLLTACLKAKNDGYDFLLSAPVDSYKIPHDLLKVLQRASIPHAMLTTKYGPHPTYCLIDLSEVDDINQAYVRGERRLQSWITPNNCGLANVPCEELINLNQIVNKL